MRRGSDRALRVAALIKRELAGLLRDKVRDPDVAGAVIADVEVSRDLSFAKVYLLPTDDAGADGGQSATLAGLERAAGFLRAALAERLRLRIVPRLQFLNDETQRRSERIEQLLAEEQQRK